MAKNTLSVRIALEGADKVREDLWGVSEAGKEAFEALQEAAADVQYATTGVAGAIGTLRERLGEVGGAIRDVASNFSFIGSEIVKLGATILGALSGRAILQMAQAWDEITMRIRNVVKPGEDVAAIMSRLAEIATDTGQSMGSTSEVFADYAKTLRDLGMSTDTTLNFIEAINSALALNGLEGAKADRVIRALMNGMREGALKGRDFTAVIDESSVITQLLADRLGVSTTRLTQMAREGRITGNVIRDALLGNISKLRTDLEGMEPTITKGLNAINVAMLQWVGTTDDATGFSQLLAGALMWVAENFNGVAIAVGVVLGLFTALKALQLAVDLFTLGRALIMLVPPLVSIGASLLLSAPLWALVALGVGAVAIAVLAMTGNLGAAGEAILSAGKSLTDFLGITTKVGDEGGESMDKLNTSTNAAQASTATMSDVMKALAQATGQWKDEGEEAADAADDLGTKGAAAGEAVQQGMEQASPAVQQIAQDADAAAEAFVRMAEAAKEAARAAAAAREAGGGGGGGASGFAGGGRVVGPGSGTSDSIMAWLSNGEYVVKAKAVRRYGARFLHAINTMQLDLPRLASGGLVSMPSLSIAAMPRFADGGMVDQTLSLDLPDAPESGGISGRPLSLSIDGETFDGLIAPEDVATRLTQYATNRQMRRAGRTPTWYRG